MNKGIISVIDSLQENVMVTGLNALKGCQASQKLEVCLNS